jgi:hypothetical protein
MRQSYGSRKIFSPAFSISRFSKGGHILGITLWWRPQALAWQACRWEHRPSSSVPCVVPIRLSRIGQHIKDEPKSTIKSYTPHLHVCTSIFKFDAIPAATNSRRYSNTENHVSSCPRRPHLSGCTRFALFVAQHLVRQPGSRDKKLLKVSYTRIRIPLSCPPSRP